MNTKRSTFHELPTTDLATMERLSWREGPAEERRPQTVLVVEDELDINYALTRRLSVAGFKAVSATEGASGLFLVETLAPDLIVLDLYLPLMDGGKVLERLRAVRRTQNTPVIVITGDHDQRVDALAREANACCVMRKPLSQRKLVDEIERILATR